MNNLNEPCITHFLGFAVPNKQQQTRHIFDSTTTFCRVHETMDATKVVIPNLEIQIKYRTYTHVQS